MLQSLTDNGIKQIKSSKTVLTVSFDASAANDTIIELKNEDIITVDTQQELEMIELDEDDGQHPEWTINYKNSTTEENSYVESNIQADVQTIISTRDLISWSFQIARGMDYLASKKVLYK